MKFQLLSLLALALTFACAEQSYGNVHALLSNPDGWTVVKETPDYLIVEIKKDMQVSVDGRSGTQFVSFQANERRVILKGRRYRSTLKASLQDGIRHSIDFEYEPREASENADPNSKT